MNKNQITARIQEIENELSNLRIELNKPDKLTNFQIGDIITAEGGLSPILIVAADWKTLLKMDDIKIHGLDMVEINILKILAERGPCSLNELRAVTGLSRMALVNNHEINLLKTNFMKINQKREITTFGRKILENFKSI